MNTILQKRIEEAADEYQNLVIEETKCHHNHTMTYAQGYEDARLLVKPTFIDAADWALQNQWISVEEALPKENRIIARLSESFCGTKDCIEVLHFCERYGLTSPEGYYDLCGENVPTNAITHWMLIPSLEGGEK